MRARLESAANGRALVLSAVLLFAIRFAAPSVTASLGVAGVDTSGLNALFSAYNAVLPVLAALLVGLVLVTPPRPLDREAWTVLALAAIAGSFVAWLGEVDPAYRLVWGAWATVPLTIAVTTAVAAYGVALDSHLGRTRIGMNPREGFRALYVSFAIAYLVGALRFLDYRYALGLSMPSGILWLLNYTPTLVPSFVSVYAWIVLSGRPERTALGIVRFLGFPLAGAVAGVVVAQGLGGFILSNVLAWGGAYEVFVPTTFSLALVGFAVGCFLATAWILRGRLDPASWRFVMAGVATTALAGILFFDGALGSLAGILLGLTLAARGLLLRRSLAGVDPSDHPRPGAPEYRE